ncbi:unnamed protein product [Symbiodinium sp. CCMP2456]|nr:unnamed protein product [Symbiodinium sp. CCMP2456]
MRGGANKKSNKRSQVWDDLDEYQCSLLNTTWLKAAHSATLRAGCDRDEALYRVLLSFSVAPRPQAEAKAQVAASRAAVAWGMQGPFALFCHVTAHRTSWFQARGGYHLDHGILHGEAHADGLQPHEVAQIASTAVSQMARAEAERGMQGLEDAAMEALACRVCCDVHARNDVFGRLARLPRGLVWIWVRSLSDRHAAARFCACFFLRSRGMSEQTSYEVAAATAAEMAEADKLLHSAAPLASAPSRASLQLRGSASRQAYATGSSVSTLNSQKPHIAFPCSDGASN